MYFSYLEQMRLEPKPRTVVGYPSISLHPKRQSFGEHCVIESEEKWALKALISYHQPLDKYEERALRCG